MKLLVRPTYLYMHLDDGFPNKRCSKEGPERNHEMPAGYSSQVKEGVGDLKHMQHMLLMIHSLRRDPCHMLTP